MQSIRARFGCWSHFLRKTGVHPGSSPGQAFSGKCSKEEIPMSRVPDLAQSEMTPEQWRIHDEIASKRRGNVRGPFAIWLRTPAIADRANQFGNAIRDAGKLDKRLFELMVIVARHWSAPYEWFAHEDQ